VAEALVPEVPERLVGHLLDVVAGAGAEGEEAEDGVLGAVDGGHAEEGRGYSRVL